MRSDIEQYVNVEFVKEHFSWVSIDYGGGTPVSIANKGVGGFIEFFLRKGAHFMVFFYARFIDVLRFSSIRLFEKKVFYIRSPFRCGIRNI